MTRGERLLTGRVATRMDGVKSSYSAKTADPAAAVGDDKGRAFTFRKGGDPDGQS
jgi:hypothetical protein